MLNHTIWIDLLNQNIIRCSWSGSQTFMNPTMAPQQSASTMVPSQQLTYTVLSPLYFIFMLPPQQSSYVILSFQQLSSVVLSFQQSSSTMLSLQHTSMMLLNVILRISIPSLLTLSTLGFTATMWFTAPEPIIISDDNGNDNLFTTSNSGHCSRPRE